MLLIYFIFILCAGANLHSGYVNLNTHDFGWATLNFVLASYFIYAIVYNFFNARKF